MVGRPVADEIQGIGGGIPEIALPCRQGPCWPTARHPYPAGQAGSHACGPSAPYPVATARRRRRAAGCLVYAGERARPKGPASGTTGPLIDLAVEAHHSLQRQRCRNGARKACAAGRGPPGHGLLVIAQHAVTR